MYNFYYIYIIFMCGLNRLITTTAGGGSEGARARLAAGRRFKRLVLELAAQVSHKFNFDAGGCEYNGNSSLWECVALFWGRGRGGVFCCCDIFICKHILNIFVIPPYPPPTHTKDGGHRAQDRDRRGPTQDGLRQDGRRCRSHR